LKKKHQNTVVCLSHNLKASKWKFWMYKARYT